MYALDLTTPPTREPVDLDLFRQHLRLNGDDEKESVAHYLTAARQTFERLAGRQLMPATYTLRLDRFPGQMPGYWPTGFQPGRGWTWTDQLNYRTIYLPMPPAVAVSAVQFYNLDGNLTTLSSSAYNVDTHKEPGRVILNIGQTWPLVSLSKSPAVVITYTAGYPTADAVPAAIKQGIMLLAETWYDQRGDVITGTIVGKLPMGFTSLVSQWSARFVSDMGMD